MSSRTDLQKLTFENTKPVLAVKFDGVIHEYNADYKKASSVVLGAPVEGAFQFLSQALDLFAVAIVSERFASHRSTQSVFRWFKQHGWPTEHGTPLKLYFPHRMPECFLLIDDRCFLFTGAFPDVVEITKFRSWMRGG